MERLKGRVLINKLSLSDDRLGWGGRRDGWRRPERKDEGENMRRKVTLLFLGNTEECEGLYQR